MADSASPPPPEPPSPQPIVAQELLGTAPMLLKETLDMVLDSKFLVTKQMTDQFMEDGVASVLMSYITRVPHDVDWSGVKFPAPLELRDRPCEDSDELRRSYRLMEFFLQKNSHFEKFVELKIDVLFRDLFNAFHPTACGSLFHWSKVFLALLQKNTSAMRALMCDDARLLERMLPFVHESPVGDALVHLIGYPQYSASDREQVWRWVERERVLFRVVETACAKPASAATISSGARQACDVVSRILDRVAALPSAGRLASQTSSREFVEPLVRGTVTTDALMDQQEACAELLCKVLAKSEERLVVEQAKSGMFPPVDLTNGFAGAHRETLLDSTVPFTKELCDCLVATQNSLKVPSEKAIARGASPSSRSDLLTTKRLVLLETINALVRARPHAVLPQLSAGFWRALGRWCDDHPEANILHLFSHRVLDLMIRHGDDALHRGPLAQSKLLTRLSRLALPVLREEARGQPMAHSSFFGFVILDCSLVILEALKRGESSYLSSLVLHSEPWPELALLVLDRCLALGGSRAWDGLNLPSQAGLAPNNAAQMMALAKQQNMTQQMQMQMMMQFQLEQQQQMRGLSGVPWVRPLVTPDPIPGAAGSANPGSGERIYSLMLGYGVDGWARLLERRAKRVADALAAAKPAPEGPVAAAAAAAGVAAAAPANGTATSDGAKKKKKKKKGKKNGGGGDGAAAGGGGGGGGGGA